MAALRVSSSVVWGAGGEVCGVRLRFLCLLCPVPHGLADCRVDAAVRPVVVVVGCVAVCVGVACRGVVVGLPVALSFACRCCLVRRKKERKTTGGQGR